MLPILRMISVGGVFLAIAILGLALMPPGRPHMQFAVDDAAARGALIDRRAHPEWRQFLIHSALRRADEIERLRDLPTDLPTRPVTRLAGHGAEPNSQVAGLPAARHETVPEDVTGSVNVAPAATMPIDIGETSSFELPVAPVDEKPPVARAPSVSAIPADSAQRSAGGRDDRTAAVQAASAVTTGTGQARGGHPQTQCAQACGPANRRPPAQIEVAVPPPFNLLQAFFASFSANQNAASAPAAKPAATRRPRAAPSRTAENR